MEKGKLTIGLPIYNEERTLIRTLESLVENIDEIDYIIISDNNSTDLTPQICKEYCKKYNKIRYYKNRENIGSWQNSVQLLGRVETEFYMQLGGHDYLFPDSIRVLKNGMAEDVVSCFGKIKDQTELDKPTSDTYIKYKGELMSEAVSKRLISYLLAGGANIVYYGIMRTDIMKKAIAYTDEYRGIAVDILVVAYMTLKGKLNYIPEVEIMVRNHNESEKEVYKRYRKCGMEVPYINPGKGFYQKMMEMVDNEADLKPKKKEIKKILNIRYKTYGNGLSWIIARSIMRASGYIKKLYRSLMAWGGGFCTRSLTFADLMRRERIQLYAGQLLDRIEKNRNLVGLVLGRGDRNSIHHDITKPYPLPDNCVYSYQSEDVFEHIEFEKMPQVLEEIYRVLKPGGILRISVPDYKHDVLKERSVWEKGEIVFDPGGGGRYEGGHVRGGGHLWFPTYEIMKKLLENSSFEKYEFLHYYDEMGVPVRNSLDHSKGYILRTPDHIGENGAISIVVDCYK